MVARNVMATNAFNVRPECCIRYSCAPAEQPVGGCEEIRKRLGLRHAAIGLHRRWSMAAYAVLAQDNAGGIFPGVRLAQLNGDIDLRFSVSGLGSLSMDIAVTIDAVVSQSD